MVYEMKYLEMEISLNNLISISLGLNAKASLMGSRVLVQAKDFSEDLVWDCAEMAAAETALLRPQHVLEKGDVLLLCKGKFFKAKLWNEKRKAVASSSYFILRCDHKKVMPAYLCWFLNTQKTQEYLFSQSSGATVRSILRKTVAGLELPLCGLEAQKKIIALDRLWIEEKALRKEFIEKKSRWLEAELFQRVKSEGKK